LVCFWRWLNTASHRFHRRMLDGRNGGCGVRRRSPRVAGGWALSLGWKGVVGLLDLGLRGGLIKGDRLLNMFQGQFVECQVFELALPFAALPRNSQREGAVVARGQGFGRRSRFMHRAWTVPARMA
jgi:hypothetical protein